MVGTNDRQFPDLGLQSNLLWGTCKLVEHIGDRFRIHSDSVQRLHQLLLRCRMVCSALGSPRRRRWS